jgi:hypothetical protein
MGLLDDAIREHLELKRRRGADPSEIAKEETEALGPVRREAAVEEPEPAGAPELADDDFGPYADAPDHDPAVAHDTPAPSAFYDDRPVPSEAPQTHDDPYAEPEDESTTPPHGDPLAHEHTREFSATELGDALGHEHDQEPPAYERPAPDPEPAPRAAEPAEDPDAEDPVDPEDELEDTPDFLQETPEHDRLWFEQKPPKDFDF